MSRIIITRTDTTHGIIDHIVVTGGMTTNTQSPYSLLYVVIVTFRINCILIDRCCFCRGNMREWFRECRIASHFIIMDQQ